MNTRDLALEQIKWVRGYTLTLLEGIADDEWFKVPDGCHTHVAWQLGHIAMAEYALGLLRIRGKEPSDEQFITSNFFKHFKKGSAPDAELNNNPSLSEIRTTFAAVHEHVLAAVPNYGEELLNEPLPAPHAVYETKLGSLFFCSAHEMLHAGQIGMLRRLLGKAPVR